MATRTADCDPHALQRATFLALGWVAFSTIGVFAVRTFVPRLEGIAVGFPILVGLSLVIAFVLALTDTWRMFGFRSSRHGQRYLLGALAVPLLIVTAPLLLGSRDLTEGDLVYLLVGYGLTGFAEETIFRGVMFHLLRGRSVQRVVLISSVLFGLVHLGNVFIRSNPAIVVAQAIGAATSGVGYGAVYALSGTIWVPIAIHFLHDLILNTGRFPVIPVDVAQAIGLFVYGVVWIRGRDERIRAGGEIDREPA